MNRSYWMGMSGLGVLLVAANLAGAAPLIWCVDAGVSASGTGHTWATAMKTIQEAMTAASADQNPPDQIWVKTGTYNPSDATSSIELKSGVQLFGGFRGNEDPSTFDPTVDQRDFNRFPTFLSGKMDGWPEAILPWGFDFFPPKRVASASHRYPDL